MPFPSYRDCYYDQQGKIRQAQLVVHTTFLAAWVGTGLAMKSHLMRQLVPPQYILVQDCDREPKQLSGQDLRLAPSFPSQNVYQ